MNARLSFRRRRLYEQILLSRSFAYLLGSLVCIVLPAYTLWGWEGLVAPNRGQLYAALAALLAYTASHRSLHTLLRYPGSGSAAGIAPQVLLIFGLVALATLALRLDMSRLLMATSGALTMLWCYADYVVRSRFQQLRLALVPYGSALEIAKLPGVQAHVLSHPDLEAEPYDVVVADLGAIPDGRWERFLARCALSRIPVCHARQMFEALTGRVRITRLSENPMGSLLPSPAYERLKYLCDLALILLSLPLVLPLALVTALAIRLESRGPAIFTQERVGQGNRIFRIYKFRSMAHTTGTADAAFASEDDRRITRVGRIIRKLRIDELPQFINVLKGEMSLIGPRPEQAAFVERFENEIPFYSYRHVVRPGITGWAQVMQGYAACADATRVKIEYDFYYIKHCSLALDFLIVLRTVQTLLTGFGAR